MYSSRSLCIVTMIGGGGFVALSGDDKNVLFMFFKPLRHASMQTTLRFVMSSIGVARTSSYVATNEKMSSSPLPHGNRRIEQGDYRCTASGDVIRRQLDRST